MNQSFYVYKILFLFFFITFSTQALAEEKLVFSADLIRHGDRNPDKEIPASPYTWKEGLGELTLAGINQEYRLGLSLRKKYIDQYHLLPKNYDAKTMYVRSTDMNRTLMSASSFLLGLYPLQSEILTVKSPNSSLFLKSQPIPIHTVPIDQDKLLAVKPSKNIFSIFSMYILNHHAWNEKSLLFKDKLQNWNKSTGMQINSFRQLDYLADNLYIRKIHNIPLPIGINQSDANEIISVAEWSIIEAFKRNEITHPMGHEFLSTLANYMKKIIHDETHLKYILFSGHDSSIMAVMNTLGHPLSKIPGYASDLNFSLWEVNGKYYVKVILNDRPIIIPGCNKNICSIEQFYKIANK
jgi:lysosomal acid phosphatase